MARNIHKTTSAKMSKCDTSSIGNKRRMARRAKTKSNKIDRRFLTKEDSYYERELINNAWDK